MSGSEIAPAFNPNDPDPVTALSGQPTLMLVSTRVRRGVPCTPTPVKYQRENPATGTVTSAASGVVPPPVVMTSTIPTTSTTCVELTTPINYFPSFNSDQGLCSVQILPRPTGTATQVGYLEDGAVHTVTIRYVASSRLFEARIDNRDYLSVTLPQDLTTMVGATNGTAYVGFTAATGADTAHHDILSWRFTTTNGQSDTIGVFRPPTTGTPKGAYYLRNSNSSGPANITAWLDFANNVNEVPVVGDWNGDGIDTVDIYNRSNGIYELVNTNANATTAAYGSPNSWPVVGDWNGDGVGWTPSPV